MNRRTISGRIDGRARFEVLTRPHIGALWRVALRMTGDRDAADELTQETCLRAFRALDRFREGTNYRAWLFRIMTNLCLDLLRRRARSPLMALGEEADPALLSAPEAEGPHAQLIRKRFREDLDGSIRKLRPEIRLVVSLALLEGLSYREVAEIADCPIGTIRSRLSRGREQLQQDLRDYMPGPTPKLRLVAGVPDPRETGRVAPLPEARSRHGRDRAG